MDNQSRFGLIKRLLFTLLILAMIVAMIGGFFILNNKIDLLGNHFNDNIYAMREAAEKYYTNDRLPKNVGDKEKLTLKEMLAKKLIVPFNDDASKDCDLNKSYVEIEKAKDEYLVDVYLTCPKKEAHINYSLGCINYCSGLGKCEQDCPCSTPVEPEKPVSKEEPKEKKPVIQYEFKRTINKDLFSHYECKEGFTLDGKSCKKTVEKVDTKDATKNYKTVTDKKPATKNEEVVKKYKYLYQKETTTTYSEWSDWSEEIEYTAADNIVWGQQELVWNEPLGGYKKTKTTTYEDGTKPLFQTYYDIIGYYDQQRCTGYEYIIIEGKTYYDENWTFSTYVTLDYVPSDSATEKYEYVGLVYDECTDVKVGCNIKAKYKYAKYVRKLNKVEDQTVLSCKYETYQVPIYGKKIKFIGYETYKKTEITWRYVYHTKTRTKLTEATTDSKWSLDKNDKSLLDQGYKFIREELAENDVIVTYSCPNGYTLNGTECSKEEKVFDKYTCPDNYELSNDKCIGKTYEVTGYDAKAIYKKSSSIEYKWANTKSLSGWTATGKTRTIYQ